LELFAIHNIINPENKCINNCWSCYWSQTCERNAYPTQGSNLHSVAVGKSKEQLNNKNRKLQHVRFANSFNASLLHMYQATLESL
jgi:hypothetical protein